MTWRLILACLLAALLPVSGAGARTARLEGRVLDIDGTPARDFDVHLIGADGAETSRARTDSAGNYAFGAVPAGRYGLAVADRAGRVAPVAGPPVRLTAGHSARRELKLLRTEPERRRQSLAGNYSLGRWWSGLSTHAKVWMVVAVVVGAWFSYEALVDDGGETAASPS